MTPEANPRIPLTMTAEVEAYIRAEFPSVYIAQLVTELDAERAARALLQSQFDNLRRDKEQGDKQNALILADYRKEVAAHAETREQLAMERSLKETLHKGVDDLGTLCGELRSQLAGTLEKGII